VIIYFLVTDCNNVFLILCEQQQQAVGCDLQLNSNLKIDACGVCGGDGSTCSTNDNNGNGNNNGNDDNGPQQRYQWEFSHQLSLCSASCDGGKMTLSGRPDHPPFYCLDPTGLFCVQAHV
jgi:hypothetical protein